MNLPGVATNVLGTHPASLIRTRLQVLDPRDDLTLAEHASAGDRAALESLYARYADPLYAFICHHLSGRTADVEDIWQDTLLAAVRSLSKYRGSSRLFTWLCGIARHKIADYLRCLGQSPVVISEVPSQQLAAMIDKGALPEESLMKLDTRVAVVAAMGALPENYRIALVVRYANQGTVADVAQSIGKTYKATESLLCRARVAFRAALLHQDETLVRDDTEDHDGQ
jgi:RNA polymerase sigma-70 factor, ECF subfamily